MRRDENLEKKNNTKIEQMLNDKKVQEWLKDNKEAIEKQNERMEKEGSFSDGHRRF